MLKKKGDDRLEVKINREIRNYTESVFFGLSLRQFFFSVCACAMAVFLYFATTDYFNKEIVSWICILGAIPFVGLGFFKYNGMPLEEFLMAFLISEVLTPRELKFESDNIYYEAIRPSLENKEREELKNK